MTKVGGSAKWSSNDVLTGTAISRHSQVQYENAIYHIVTRGDGRIQLFYEEGHYDRITDGVVTKVDDTNGE